MATKDHDSNWLSWVNPAKIPDAQRPPPPPSPPAVSLWAPMQRLVQRTFGPLPLSKMLRDDDDNGPEDKGCGLTAPEDAQKHTKNVLRRSKKLMCQGAQAPSMYFGDAADLKETPTAMAKSDGAVQLFPFQLAAAGRLFKILLTYSCALLAFDMGLGKTFIITASLAAMGFGTSRKQGPVLVVLPFGLLKQWHDHLTTNLKPYPKVCVYHDGKLNGQPTHTNYGVADLGKFDIVLTTYNLVRIEHETMVSTKGKFQSWKRLSYPPDFPKLGRFPLFALDWWFVILDEAHKVANPQTSISIAARALPGTYRVAITGTPLQNDYTDVQGLLAFMHLEPWSDLTVFKQYFIQKRSKKNHGDVLNANLTAILAATLKAVSLRMTKHDKFNGSPVVLFRPASENLVEHTLNAAQQQVQDRVKHIWDPITRADLDADRQLLGSRGPLSPKETFPAIMEARLSPIHEACPSAGYGEAANGETDLVEGPGGLKETELEDLLFRIVEQGPMASSKKTKKSKDAREAFRTRMQTGWKSTRMIKMLSIIDKQKKRGKKGKFIIFSEFLCALDVVHAALESRNFKVLRYDGWETPAEKERTLALFQDPQDDHEFILVTNRSGGEGLNLQTATTVIHINPCWNPAMTMQLNSRAVRIGQENDVDVFYLCVQESMEGHIRRLAKVKDLKASALLDPTDDTLKLIIEASQWSMAEYREVMDLARESADKFREKEKARRLKRELALKLRAGAVRIRQARDEEVSADDPDSSIADSGSDPDESN